MGDRQCRSNWLRGFRFPCGNQAGVTATRRARTAMVRRKALESERRDEGRAGGSCQTWLPPVQDRWGTRYSFLSRELQDGCDLGGRRLESLAASGKHVSNNTGKRHPMSKFMVLAGVMLAAFAGAANSNGDDQEGGLDRFLGEPPQHGRRLDVGAGNPVHRPLQPRLAAARRTHRRRDNPRLGAITSASNFCFGSCLLHAARNSYPSVCSSSDLSVIGTRRARNPESVRSSASSNVGSRTQSNGYRVTAGRARSARCPPPEASARAHATSPRRQKRPPSPFLRTSPFLCVSQVLYDGGGYGRGDGLMAGLVRLPVKRLVYEGPSDYSSLAAGRPGATSQGWIYLLFEAGDRKLYEDGRIARFNLAWLLDGEPTGDGTIPAWAAGG
jgi:hypothetical protein